VGTGAKLALAVLALGLLFAYMHWPRLNDVETGRTPEYPELQVREYQAGEERVTKAAKGAVAALPGWELVGAGRGPGGSEIQAVARTRVFRFKDDVTIRIRTAGRTSRVSVRSRSRVGRFDFGQNARNIRAFLAELDRQMFS
jgi:uncharacterized protein (DUF1499 family)